jgi:hypothetical protein
MTDTNTLVKVLDARFDDFKLYLNDRLVRLENAINERAHKDDVVEVREEIEEVKAELDEVRSMAKKSNGIVDFAERAGVVVKWVVGLGTVSGGSVGLNELFHALTRGGTEPPLP